MGMGGILIQYKGYIEVYLIIPDLSKYNKDVLFLVISDNKYGERVPVQIGTQAEETWKQVHFSTVICKRNTVKGLSVPEYDLKVVKGKICAVREVPNFAIWDHCGKGY